MGQHNDSEARPANLKAMLTSCQRAYLSELAAEIVENGNPAGDLFDEMEAAHARRQAFAQEMAAGVTGRAKAVRRVMAAQLWINAQAASAINAAMFEAGQAVQA